MPFGTRLPAIIVSRILSRIVAGTVGYRRRTSSQTPFSSGRDSRSWWVMAVEAEGIWARISSRSRVWYVGWRVRR